jgi:hypothetical protein
VQAPPTEARAIIATGSESSIKFLNPRELCLYTSRRFQQELQAKILDSIQQSSDPKVLRILRRMAMKLVKKTEQYTIYKRGDERYAVMNTRKQFVNGESKALILLEEGLIKAMVPAKPAVEASAEQAPADAADPEASTQSA